MRNAAPTQAQSQSVHRYLGVIEEQNCQDAHLRRQTMPRRRTQAVPCPDRMFAGQLIAHLRRPRVHSALCVRDTGQRMHSAAAWTAVFPRSEAARREPVAGTCVTMPATRECNRTVQDAEANGLAMCNDPTQRRAANHGCRREIVRRRWTLDAGRYCDRDMVLPCPKPHICAKTQGTETHDTCAGCFSR